MEFDSANWPSCKLLQNNALGGPEAGFEPAPPGLEEQWREAEAAAFATTCNATHAGYPRDLSGLRFTEDDCFIRLLLRAVLSPAVRRDIAGLSSGRQLENQVIA